MHIEKDQRHIRLNEEGEASRSKGKENVTSKAAVSAVCSQGFLNACTFGLSY